MDAAEDTQKGRFSKEHETDGPSAKKKPYGQGIGLQNVGDVVRKYSGVMNTEIQDGMFAISVLLPFEDRM